MRIIGIDLAGVDKKTTGFAVLKRGMKVETKPLHTDEEIIEATLKANPDLVTIDAPLGLPKGRCCIEYNCKCVKFGYTRQCERELYKMHIRVFPCGFAGMQKLTKRGIRLRKFFEAKGFKVIETYPGSAQDLLGIPRKGDNHKPLQRALIKHGFKGDVARKDITHDELDAITSALVGHLYLENKTLALGIKEESQIITAMPKKVLNKKSKKQ
jgi:predicted nuclease with RNAse H fold